MSWPEILHRFLHDPFPRADPHEHCHQIIPPAGDVRLFAFLQGPQCAANDFFGRVQPPLLEPAGDTGNLEELGAGGAGTEGMRVTPLSWIQAPSASANCRMKPLLAA